MFKETDWVEILQGIYKDHQGLVKEVIGDSANVFPLIGPNGKMIHPVPYMHYQLHELRNLEEKIQPTIEPLLDRRAAVMATREKKAYIPQ